jgi:DNA-directed RNA polymerase subunit E'/Rpb7
MEQLAIFEEKVILTPSDLRPEIESFDDILLGKLKATLEGKCSKHGYVIPKSLELLSRSMGAAEKGHFTSDFLYYMKVQGKVYNPPDGLEVEGEVVRKNKMGLYVIIEDAIRIMVPRDLHIGNEEFDAIELGDRIRIEIKKSRFQVNDTHILSIGQYLGTVGTDSGSALAEAGEAEAEAGEAEAGEEEAEAEAEAEAGEAEAQAEAEEDENAEDEEEEEEAAE